MYLLPSQLHLNGRSTCDMFAFCEQVCFRVISVSNQAALDEAYSKGMQDMKRQLEKEFALAQQEQAKKTVEYTLERERALEEQAKQVASDLRKKEFS